MKKTNHPLLTIAMILAGLSCIAILLSFYFSHDPNQLYKLCLPLIIFVVASMQLRKNKNHPS